MKNTLYSRPPPAAIATAITMLEFIVIDLEGRRAFTLA